MSSNFVGRRQTHPTGSLWRTLKDHLCQNQRRKRTKKNEPYQFQIKTHEKSEKLATRIKALYETQRQREPNVFTDTIKVDDAVLRTVVSHLEGINLNKTDLDTKGVAFEQFMDGFFKGDFGQYFTPREVIAFAVEMMRPSHEEYVLDPACGSGGFLLYALDEVRREADAYYDEGSMNITATGMILPRTISLESN